MFRYDLNELRQLSADSVESLRFVRATDATTKYGIGFAAGAIEVTTRGR